MISQKILVSAMQHEILHCASRYSVFQISSSSLEQSFHFDLQVFASEQYLIGQNCPIITFPGIQPCFLLILERLFSGRLRSPNFSGGASLERMILCEIIMPVHNKGQKMLQCRLKQIIICCTWIKQFTKQTDQSQYKKKSNLVVFQLLDV